MPKDTYTPEQIETCLVYLAMAADSPTTALRRLAEDGEKVPPKSTLHQWATRTYAPRFQELLAEKEQQRRLKAATRIEALSNRDLDLYESYQDKLEAALEAGDINVRDLTRGMRDLALSMGIKVDKTNVLRDRPTAIVRTGPSMQEIEDGLRKLGVLETAAVGTAADIDSTAVELEA